MHQYLDSIRLCPTLLSGTVQLKFEVYTNNWRNRRYSPISGIERRLKIQRIHATRRREACIRGSFASHVLKIRQ